MYDFLDDVAVPWSRSDESSLIEWDARRLLGDPYFRDVQAPILLVGHSRDLDLGHLAVRLADAGVDADVLLVDRIGHQPGLTVPADGDRKHYDVGYCRHYQPNASIHYHFDRSFRRSQDWGAVGQGCGEYANEQAATLFWYWLARIQVDRWLNEPGVLRRASNKLLQLSAADEVGLRVPASLVTCGVQEFRAFAADLNDGVVYKSLDSPWAQRSPANDSFVFSTPVELEAITNLRYPALFQERLRPTREIRVTFIGGRAFCAALDRPPGSEVDWRRTAEAHQQFVHYSLPSATLDRLRTVMDVLGLQVGAADLIETQSGTYFLEINPSAAFMWLERRLGMKLCETIMNAICFGV